MIETPYMKIFFQRGILHGIYREGINIDLNTAKAATEKRMEVCSGQACFVIVDISGVKSISKEARDYLAKDGARLIKAGAIITRNPLSVLLGNFFLSISKPDTPTKLFKNSSDAEKWLKGREKLS